MSQSSSQYHAFIKEIMKNKSVWTVKDEQGFPTSTNLNGEITMPFWSLKSRAEKLIASAKAYSFFKPHEIGLEDFLNEWLTGFEKDGLRVGVNWTGNRATGYDLQPSEIAERIKYERENS